jgi:hypothetical protein
MAIASLADRDAALPGSVAPRRIARIVFPVGVETPGGGEEMESHAPEAQPPAGVTGAPPLWLRRRAFRPTRVAELPTDSAKAVGG